MVKKIELFNGDTGNKEEATYDGGHFQDGKFRDLKGRTHAVDPNEVCCEVYNYESFEIIFLSMKNPSLMPIICKPKDHCFLPHQYFIMRAQPGFENAPIRILKNYGDMMGKRNTLPSRPEAKTKIIK